MASALVLALQSQRGPAYVAQLARDLKSDIGHRADIEVQDVTSPPKSGERTPDVSLLGQLALTFLTSGAAVALVGCLKAYIGRDHTLRFKLTRSDGSCLDVEGKDLDAGRLDQTLRLIDSFVLGPRR
jgi:hypothetical protein